MTKLVNRNHRLLVEWVTSRIGYAPYRHVSFIIDDSALSYGDRPVRPLYPLRNKNYGKRNEQEKRLGVVTGELGKYPDTRCQYQNRMQ